VEAVMVAPATQEGSAQRRELDRIETLIGTCLAERLRSLASGRSVGTALDRRTAAALLPLLERWRRGTDTPLGARRAEMLWRQVVHGLVAADPQVAETEEAARSDGGRRAMVHVFAARNRAARQLGWPDYYELHLALEELSPAVVTAAFATVERASRAAWARARGMPALRVAPAAWPLDAALALARRWFAAAALPIDAVRITARAAMPLGYRTFLVDPPREIEVLVQAPHSSGTWRCLWHELGHAAYAAHHDPALPWSLRAAPSRCVHEAVAELCADAVDRSPLLEEIHRAGPTDVPALRRARAAARLRWRREQLLRTAFERDCYRCPGSALDARYQALRAQLLGPVADRSDWLEVTHYLEDPVSQPVYLVAEVQRAVLARQRIDAARPLGQVLCQPLFRHGARLSWRSPGPWRALGVWPALRAQLGL
jgi:hypothetical protein